MYDVGDKIVHPSHGAGIIRAVEEKDVLDEFNRYYIIELAAQDLRIMVPVRSADEIGLRRVATKRTSKSIFKILSGRADSLPDDFKKRQALIMDRLREGDTKSLARVVRDMAARSREKTYSPTEARLYDQARAMLSGEVALSLEESVESTLERIDKVAAEALPPEPVEPADQEAG